MKKRLLCIMLIMALFLSFMPNLTQAASFGSDWIELTPEYLASKDYRLVEGDYYLTGDLVLNERICLGLYLTHENITIDLNGYILALASGSIDSEILKIENWAMVTIQDSEPTRSHTDSSLPKGGILSSNNMSGNIVTINPGCRLSLISGSILMKNHVNGVYNQGTFRIDDNGKITSFRTDTNVRAVYNLYTMYAEGGVIDGNILNAAEGSTVTRTNFESFTLFNGDIYNDAGGEITESVYPYTITFNSNGGSTVAEQKILKGHKAIEPANPSKTGFSFGGWYTSDSQLYDFSQTVTSSATLNAQWTHTDNDHYDDNDDHYCDEPSCGIRCSECSGGTDRRNCVTKAVCEICGDEYGEVDSSKHANLVHVNAKDPTTREEGNIEYWYCNACNKYFSDVDLANEITFEETVIPRRELNEDGSSSNTELNENDLSPKTGDDNNIYLLVSLFAISLLGIAALFVYKRRKI